MHQHVKVTDSYLFKSYLESMRDSMHRRPAYFQIDKGYLALTWGSVSNGLVFYHHIFTRLSVEFGLKFVIQTNPVDPSKFNVTFTRKSPF